jgi:hypothetical protein
MVVRSRDKKRDRRFMALSSKAGKEAKCPPQRRLAPDLLFVNQYIIKLTRTGLAEAEKGFKPGLRYLRSDSNQNKKADPGTRGRPERTGDSHFFLPPGPPRGSFG